MAALLDEDREVFALHAATAFEHLAKARLAKIHPSIIADGRDFQSLLHACGQPALATKSQKGSRTISLREAVKRVAQVEAQVRPETGPLELLADARNGVAHIGREADGLDRTVVVPFVRACEVLLPTLALSREDFWGDYIETIDARLSTVENDALVRVADKLTRARAAYAQKFSDLEQHLVNQVLTLITENYAFEKYESRIIECPACSNEALQAGYFNFEWEADYEHEGRDEYTIHAYPKVTVIGDFVRCGACGLELEGADELRAADVEITWEEIGDPADFYEPDYE